MDSAVKNSERLDFERQERDWGLGESARMSVRQKKSWFRTAELANPDKTVYSTTSESMLVIEPDGTATCVGTQGCRRLSGAGRGARDLSKTGDTSKLNKIRKDSKEPSHEKSQCD